jgi:four helix bundle protein
MGGRGSDVAYSADSTMVERARGFCKLSRQWIQALCVSISLEGCNSRYPGRTLTDDAADGAGFLLLFRLLLRLLGARMPPSSHLHFDHEKLVAYQRSIQFVAWVSQLIEELPPRLAVSDQLDRASTSVPLNLAEGNGKYTAPDRCRYFENARGSALECAACLDVLVAQRKCTTDQIQSGKGILHETVCLVVGLIKSIAPDRLREEPSPYGRPTETLSTHAEAE